VNFNGKTCYRTLSSVRISNLLRIRSKMAQLWPFNWFQDGGPSWILAAVNFDGKSGCGILFSASVSNSVEICAILTKLWQKMRISIWRPAPSWILLDRGSDVQKCSGTSVKFGANPFKKRKWPIYSRLTDFKMAAVCHLEFASSVNFYHLLVLG